MFKIKKRKTKEDFSRTQVRTPKYCYHYNHYLKKSKIFEI